MSDHIVECTTTDNRVLHGARVRENHRQRQSSTPRSDLQIMEPPPARPSGSPRESSGIDYDRLAGGPW